MTRHPYDLDQDGDPVEPHHPADADDSMVLRLEPWNRPWVAQCACGRGYWLPQFERLELCGTMVEDGLELRHCVCGSTLSREIV